MTAEPGSPDKSSKPASASSSRAASAFEGGSSKPGSATPSRAVSAKEGTSSKTSSATSRRPLSAKEAASRAASAAKIVAALSRPGSGLKTMAWSEPQKEKEAQVTDVLIDEEDDDFDEDELKNPKSCWERVSDTFTSIWRTTDMMSGEETVTIVRTTTRELAIYLIFMVVLCFVTLTNMSPRQYEFTDVLLNQIFVNNSNVGNIFDVWQILNTDWAMDPELPLPPRDFIAGAYKEVNYNIGDMPEKYPCPGLGPNVTGPCPIPMKDRLIMLNTKLLGVPRLRQLRVRNDSCIVPTLFKSTIKVCYDQYSPAIEDQTDFAPNVIRYTSRDAWRYQTEKELQGNSYWGSLATYSGAGSVQDLAQTVAETKVILRELMEGLWIGRGTRFVTLDFTLYNADVNLFCVIKMFYEFPPTGGVLPGEDFATVKLLKYVNAWDYAVLGGEFIFAIFVLYYAVEEILELRKMKFEYFSSFWNCLDLFVIGISVCTICFSIYRYIIVSVLLKSLLAEPNVYPDFTNLAFWHQTFQNGAGITIFVSWIKIFKYLSFNKTMTQLSGTLTQCAGDVGAFSIMFFIVFLAFAQFAYLILGAKIDIYSTMTMTVYSQFRTILGDFDFPSIEAADHVLGPVWFISFIFFIFFILMNMFLAIINDTYSEVKAEVNSRKENFQMGDFIMRGFNNIRGSVADRDKLIDIKTTIKLANEDGVVTFEEIRDSLRKLNFSDTEIEVFCSRYDVDGNFEFSFEEVQAAIEETLNEEIIKFENEKPDNEKKSLAFNLLMFEGLQTRVDHMSDSMSRVLKKVNTVLEKLDAIERPKSSKSLHSRPASTKSNVSRPPSSRSNQSRPVSTKSVHSSKGEEEETDPNIQALADQELNKFEE